MQTETLKPTPPAAHATDTLRQALNLLLSVAQFAASIVLFSGEFGDKLFYDPNAIEPYFLPSDYVFTVWAFIYPASIAYGVYQALPGQRAHPLLRRIGFYTAFSFFCITAWSLVTLLDPVRYTVPCFFGALFGLIVSIVQIARHAPPLTRNENLLIVWPLSVFAAWCTAGSIANVTTSLYALGVRDLVLPELVWALVMLAAAALIGGFTTIVTRGNLTYALTIIWALVGIAVGVLERDLNPTASAFAVAMAGVVAAATWWGQHHHRLQASPAR